MLQELLEKDCPFKPYQFLEAKMVLNWLMKNVNDPELEKNMDYYCFRQS